MMPKSGAWTTCLCQLLYAMTLLFGLSLAASDPVFAGALQPAPKVASGSAAVDVSVLGENIPPSSERAGENSLLSYDFASDFPVAARATTIGAKTAGQLAGRGWSRSSIDDAISNPTRTVATRDTQHLPGGGRNNDPATAYYSRDGGYVVRNDRSGDIVQVSNRNDPNWRAPWD